MPLIKDFSIQLYSVRDIIGNDFSGTLKKLAEMGYTGVEFAGWYYGISAAEMKEILAANNLKSVGAHIRLDSLTQRFLAQKLDEEIEYHKVLGTEYLICPNSPVKAKDDVIDLAKTLTFVTEKTTSAGFKFAYHNHAHEFVTADGDYLLDILFDNLPPQAIMELDIYWAAHADVDPFAYMEKHKDRLKLVHVKQIDKNKRCVDLDQGILDFKEIISKAKSLGVEHFILEQEEYAISSMTSVKNGIDYIMSLN